MSSCTTGLKKLGFPDAGLEEDRDTVDGVCCMILVLGVCRIGKLLPKALTAPVSVWHVVSNDVVDVSTVGGPLMYSVLVRVSWSDGNESGKGPLADEEARERGS